MSDRATSSDVMKELHALRGDVHTQGQDLRRLLEQHNEHERRIAALEPMKESVHDLIECNYNIMRELELIREGQKNAMEDISRRVEKSLRADLLDLRRDLRTELAAVRIAQDKLTQTLLDRPCVVAGDCNIVK